jgi:CRP/FNR family transcriptional regulator, cyclic AMP receptor protein
MELQAEVLSWRRVIRTSAWFASIPDDLAMRLLCNAQLRQFNKSEKLFSYGDTSDGLYCLVDGVVCLTRVTQEGRESLLTTLDAPHWFGIVSLFDGQPRTHDVWAETKVTAIYISRDALLQLLDEHPIYWAQFGKLMANKLRVIFSAIEECSVLSPTARLARRLVGLASGYSDKYDPPKSMLRVSQEKLGMMLMLSRQTVNQSLCALQEAGAIRRHRGMIEIVDLNKLLDNGA